MAGQFGNGKNSTQSCSRLGFAPRKASQSHGRVMPITACVPSHRKDWLLVASVSEEIAFGLQG